MSKVLIEDYLKEGPKKALFLCRAKDNYLSDRLLSAIDVQNNIENTGKSCLLLPSKELNLII